LRLCNPSPPRSILSNFSKVRGETFFCRQKTLGERRSSIAGKNDVVKYRYIIQLSMFAPSCRWLNIFYWGKKKGNLLYRADKRWSLGYADSIPVKTRAIDGIKLSHFFPPSVPWPTFQEATPSCEGRQIDKEGGTRVLLCQNRTETKGGRSRKRRRNRNLRVVAHFFHTADDGLFSARISACLSAILTYLPGSTTVFVDDGATQT